MMKHLKLLLIHLCCLIRQEAEEEKSLTFEELKKRDFLKLLCLLLLTVWFGLHIVCTVLDKYGNRTSLLLLLGSLLVLHT